MCVICGLYDAVVKRPDGIYVLPIHKEWYIEGEDYVQIFNHNS